MQIYTNALPGETASVLKELGRAEPLRQFYLSGGTALALQLGHRESEDLDFFSQTDFEPAGLQQKLSTRLALEDVVLAEGTLNAFAAGSVKLQFLHYPYNLLERPLEWNSIALSSVDDIACTKLLTVSSRGSKKDFIDLHTVLETTTLEDLLQKLDAKYRDINYNIPHILKSLTYFEDADDQPMPRMHTDISWRTVKQTIEQKVKALEL